MKRWSRRLLAAACAASAVLFVAAVVMWVRSYWVRDLVAWGRAGGNCHVAQSILGRVHVLTNLDGGCSGGASYDADRLSPQAVWNGGLSGYPPGLIRWRLGFAYETYTRGYLDLSMRRTLVPNHHRLVVVPYWFPAALFAVAPVIWVAFYVRRRRRGVAGRCRRCGYDLTGNVSGVCPECGTSVVTSRAG